MPATRPATRGLRWRTNPSRRSARAPQLCKRHWPRASRTRRLLTRYSTRSAAQTQPAKRLRRCASKLWNSSRQAERRQPRGRSRRPMSRKLLRMPRPPRLQLTRPRRQRRLPSLQASVANSPKRAKSQPLPTLATPSAKRRRWRSRLLSPQSALSWQLWPPISRSWHSCQAVPTHYSPHPPETWAQLRRWSVRSMTRPCFGLNWRRRWRSPTRCASSRRT
mmetsp:Transcript_31844/g.79448  ORF Transcript_31844/g.79448 Transcript_31844/m.79448 type:complete len:220 (+) Transcript_31844:1584-2243(+)